MFTRGYSTLTGAYFAGGLLHVCIIQPYQVINPKVCMLMGLCQPKFSWWFDSPIVNTHLELQRESAVRVLSGSITILQELISQLHQFLGKKTMVIPMVIPIFGGPGNTGLFPSHRGRHRDLHRVARIHPCALVFRPTGGDRNR